MIAVSTALIGHIDQRRLPAGPTTLWGRLRCAVYSWEPRKGLARLTKHISGWSLSMKPILSSVALVSALTLGWVSGGQAQEIDQLARNGPTLAPVSVNLIDAPLSDVNEALC